MGFFSSLKTQLGRDTGRFISNKIFGDRHATKYQRVSSTGKSLLGSTNNTSSGNFNNSNSPKRGLLSSFFRTSGNFLLEQTKASLESKRREEEYIKQIQQEDSVKLKKSIEKLISTKIPNQKQSLIDMMFKLSSIISHNSYKNVLEEENVLANKYTDVALKKYEHCLYVLKTKFPKADEIHFFEEKYHKKKRKAFFQRYWSFLLMVIFFLIAAIMAYFEEEKPQPIRQETTIERIIDKFKNNE